MSNSIEGGELIELVDIGQDFCENLYGDGIAPKNIIKYSENYTKSPWLKTNANVSPNHAADPYSTQGGLSLLELAPGETSGLIAQFFDGVSGVDYTFSVLVSARGSDTVELVINTLSTRAHVVFDLTAVTGTPNLTSGGEAPLNYAITLVEGDVYRISVGRTSPVTSPNTTVTVNINGSVAIGAAQLEVATAGPTTYESTVGGLCLAALGTTGEHKCFNTRVSCQDPANYILGSLGIKVCDAKTPLPRDQYRFPSLISIDSNPSALNSSSRREKSALGVRASMTMTAQDHPHTDRYVDPYAEERLSGAAQNDGIGYDPYERSSMWAKWRVRNPYYFGRPISTTMGVAALPDLSNLVTRNYVIEKVTGPDSTGKFQITGKDPLKLLDDERAQAPKQSLGELAASIDAVVTSASLAPAGIGDSNYATSGVLAIGKEVVDFTRSGDALTLVRGQYGSTAKDHSSGDTVQECLVIESLNVSDIVHLLITTYSALNATYLPKADWDAEIGTFIPGLYSAIITKPTGLKTLIGELEEEAGFSIWWDDITQTIPMAAVKQPGAFALTVTDNDIIAGSLKIDDMPDARISQVWTSFGVLNPADSLEDENNYRSTAVSSDVAAGGVQEYAQEAVVRIFSRWIGQFNKGSALSLNTRLLSRFRDPPRLISFHLNIRYSDLIKIGGSHRINTRRIPVLIGANDNTPIRILSAEPSGDRVKYRAEEIKFFSPPNNLVRDLYIDTLGARDYNLREQHDQFNSPPTGVETVNLFIEEGAIVGATTATALGSLIIGDWPVGTVINVIQFASGYTSGAGGKGGRAGLENGAQRFGLPGEKGGTAIYTRRPINLIYHGIIQAGGGGGGGGDRQSVPFENVIPGGSGGGGAGDIGGPYGDAFALDYRGENGTLTTGGAGGQSANDGGAGGAPAMPGFASPDAGPDTGAPGGAAGVAIDGISYVTVDEPSLVTLYGASSGTIIGTQIN